MAENIVTTLNNVIVNKMDVQYALKNNKKFNNNFTITIGKKLNVF